MFRNISIRGRVAFAIRLLENVLENQEISLMDYSLILDKLWAYIEMSRLDIWHEMLAEYLPNSVLNDEFIENECDYITEEEFFHLKGLYSGTKEYILDMMMQIFYIGTIELYGQPVQHGFQSLQEMSKLLKIAEKNKIKVPDAKPYIKFSWMANNGFGERFNRSDVPQSPKRETNGW